MPELSHEERNKLSTEAAEHYEARLFVERTPEYFPCPTNVNTMIEYLTKHKLAPVYNNFVKAYTALKKQRKILPAAEVVSRMKPEEFQEMAAKVGTPVRNYAGQIVGYDLPYSSQQANWSVNHRLPLHGREANEYREWCVKNNFDPDTGEKTK